MAILQLEICHREAKNKTKIETKTAPSLSRELQKRDTQSPDCGSVLPKASLFANIFTLQKQMLSSFPRWGFSISPGLFAPV